MKKTKTTPDTGHRAVWIARAALAAIAVAVVVGLALLWPSRDAEPVGPESRLPDTEAARVIEIAEVECQVPSADACIEVTAEVLSGPDRGDEASFIMGDVGSETTADIGDEIRVVKSTVPEGGQIGGVEIPPYSFSDFERREPTLWLVALFVAVVVVTSRFHGIRALSGLVASLGIVVLFIVPALVQGTSPLLVAIVGSLAVMLLTIPLAHGLGPVTIAASLGTTVALLLTLALATTWAKLSHLSGFASDEVAYLNAYLGDLSIQGLLLAGIVISALGVLDDVTVSQASTVMALKRAAPHLAFRPLVRESIVVGRDHIAATVNTLVLAYTGASLPILLVFSIGEVDALDAFNGEAVASQVVAMLVGSIGLIAAMPVTTLLAALLATRMAPRELDSATAHAHAHGH